MNNAWKKLQESNRRSENVRKEEQREYTRQFLYALPLFPAVFLLAFADEAAVDVISRAPFLNSLRDWVGAVITGYVIVFAYALLIQLVELGFYRQLSWMSRLVVAWCMWGWFYYSTWIIGDIRAAFLAAFIIGVFMIQIVGVFIFCYKTIRKGMFFGKSDPDL